LKPPHQGFFSRLRAIEGAASEPKPAPIPRSPRPPLIPVLVLIVALAAAFLVAIAAMLKCF
jgi:hypothetical protein